MVDGQQRLQAMMRSFQEQAAMSRSHVALQHEILDAIRMATQNAAQQLDAQRPDQAAVRWADLFTAGRDECRLLLTNRRLALVVEGELTRPAAPVSGGLLGRVRSPGQSQSQPDVPPLVTWWEAPVGTARFLAVPLGRQVQPEWFVRVEFSDGSAFEFRDAQAEQSVRTAYANL